MQRSFFALTLFFLLFTVGCGDKVVVKGTAKLADGTTITKGTVVFHSDKETFQADIQPGGSFSPGKLKDGDGIPRGVYQIYLTGVLSGETPGPYDEAPASVSLIHSRYSQPDSSGLSFDTSKSKTLDLVLDPAE